MKINEKPYVKFIGSNATEVTGSANLLKFKDSTILIDYGLRQSNSDESDYIINNKRHKDIKPKQLTAVILTHVHLDHSGLIPKLFKDGANCPIYVPIECKKILTLMWQDCAKIFEKNSVKYNNTPIYTQEDIDKALSHIVECELKYPINITNEISFAYYNAQHIVKACQVYIEIDNGINIKKIGFTGDISNKINTYYLGEFESLPQVDTLIGECTYSDEKRLHKINDRQKDKEKIRTVVQQALSNKGKILIPVFSLDRLQNVLTTLYKLYDGKSPIKILIDSPLGRNISEIWEYMIDDNQELWNEVYHWEDCLWIRDFKDSLLWNKIDEPLLIIGGGGFLQGGRATFWAKELLNNKRNYILFCGYSTPDSTAGKIKNRELKEIKIDGKNISINADIGVLNSFSSHMDYQQLMKYYTQTEYNKLCLVHSDFDNKIKFAQELRKQLSESNRSSQVIVTNFESKIYV